jgi:hypothetical protein
MGDKNPKQTMKKKKVVEKPKAQSATTAGETAGVKKPKK